MTRREALVGLGLLLMASLLAAGLVAGAGITSDEGFYLEAAREAVSGRVLYRDFGFTQGPLVPLVTGMAMKFLGYGLLTQRALNALFGLVAIGVFLVLACSEAGGLALRTTGITLACSTLFLHNVTVGNTYGLTSLLLALACAAGLRLRGEGARAAATAALCALAFGCRLPVAPFAAVFLASVVFRSFSWRSATLSVATSAGVVLMLFGPFLRADASNLLFWTIGYHRASALHRPRAEFLWEAWALCPALPLLLAVGLLACRRPARGGMARDAAPGLLFASLTGMAFHAVLPSTYGGYLTPFVGPAILASSVLAARRLSPAGQRATEIGAILIAVSGVFVLRPVVDQAGIGDLHAVARILRTATPADGIVVTTMPEAAVEADRRCLPGLEMGKFGFTDTLPADLAARRRMMDAGRLVGALERGEAAAIVFSRSRDYNFAWTAPSLAYTRPETRESIRRAIDARYDLVHEGPAYFLFLPRRRAGSPG